MLSMNNAVSSIRVVLVLPILLSATTRGDEPVAARVETTLSTREDNIRQLAFDGVGTTFFESENKATAEDHFTLVLDKPVTLTSIGVTTGSPDRSKAVAGGTLEVSPDGQSFRELARFTDGVARAGSAGNPIRAILIRPGASSGPIAIREISLVSDPPVAIFKYPVEFLVDVSDAPDLKPWAEMVARTCEQAYPMINDELASDGFVPPRVIRLKLSKDYDGVAGTSRDLIVGSVDFFRRHPKDIGAMVHETVHVVQAYRRGHRPGWLVEGISDYVRFFKYEPGKLGQIDPRTAHYNGSYRVSAAFLAYLVAKYDKDIVRKLNGMLREGRYEEDAFQKLTGKPLRELDEEWRATLRP
jgi:hypothetical protein